MLHCVGNINWSNAKTKPYQIYETNTTDDEMIIYSEIFNRFKDVINEIRSIIMIMLTMDDPIGNE